MAGQWFYTHLGEQLGPVTTEQLKALAISKGILPADRVRQERQAEWATAGKLPWLFQQPARDQSAPPTMPAPDAADAAARASSIARKAGETIGHGLKAARQLTAKRAMRAKLTAMTLPNAYKNLGRHLEGSDIFSHEFPDLFQQYDRLRVTISSLRNGAAKQAPASGFKARIIGIAFAARARVQTKWLERRVRHILGEFGEAAFAKQGEKCGPAEIVAPIARALSQIAELDKDIDILLGLKLVAELSSPTMSSTGDARGRGVKAAAQLAASRRAQAAETHPRQTVICPRCQHSFGADLAKRIKCPSCRKGWFPWEVGATATVVQDDATAPTDLRRLPNSTGRMASFDLAKTETRIGRSPDNDIVLDNLMISRRHALLRRVGGEIIAEDLGATNGTYLNERRLALPHPLAKGDTLAIGPYCLVFDGSKLTLTRPEMGVEIGVRGLCEEVADRQTGSARMLLQDISLTIRPGEFVGLLGTSGAGKSTLVGAISGRRPGTHGEVLLNGENLYTRFDALKAGIGFVPQEVIFHDVLPLVEALRYTSRLRLSKDASQEEIESNIDRVLKTVGLTESKATIIKNLSGGQKKRVSIAMELLSQPRILFLDEVTSGLDPRTEKQMMKLFRELANNGITVICITHYANSVEICDQIAYLNAGLLVFYGPPVRCKEYFGVEQLEAAYDKEEEKTPTQWQNDFRGSAAYREFVALRGEIRTDQHAAQRYTRRPEEIDWVQLRRQLAVLTRRYVRVLSIDRRNLLLLLGLPPLTAILLCILSSSIEVPAVIDNASYGVWAHKQIILCFGPIIIMFLLTMFGAVREIVKELSIYQHERFINLRIVPYLLSKIGPLTMIAAVQTLSVIFIINCFADMKAGSILSQFITLFLVSVCGMLAGLAISAWVKSSDWAVMLMIGVVIPQILFAGGLVPVRGASAFIGEGFVSAYWALEAMKSQLPSNSHGWGLSVGVLLLHVITSALLVFLLMLRKDGPGALHRITRSLALLAGLNANDTDPKAVAVLGRGLSRLTRMVLRGTRAQISRLLIK